MLGSRMRQMRRARGWTLEELSSRMDGLVSKQALSKWEAGTAMPRPTSLIALAAAFGVKATDLVSESSYSIECLEYRARAPLAVRARERVEARLSANLEKRLRLEDRLGSPKECGLPQARLVASLDDAEAAARALRVEWGLGPSVIASVSDLLEAHSIHVFEIAGEVDFDGLAAVARCEDGALRAVGIGENPDTFGDRQRFNLAHELGHVLMIVDPSLDEEKAANRFAGAFLIPRELVVQEMGERRSDVAWDELLLLKQLWGVSIQAILHRLVELDVISRSHYEWWTREIRALGYKIVEPLKLPRESSTWEARRLARAEAEGLLSREQVAAYALPGAPSSAPILMDSRSMMSLSLDDRRALLKSHAERLVAYYEEEARGDWVDGGFDEPE